MQINIYYNQKYIIWRNRNWMQIWTENTATIKEWNISEEDMQI